MGRTLLLAVLFAASAAAAPTTTATDRAHTTPDRHAARLLDQLKDLMQLPADSRTPNAPLLGETYELIPTGTDLPNLCRRDTLAFYLDPQGTDEPNAKTAVRTSGIALAQTYFYIGDPVPGEQNQAARWKLNRACARAPKDAVRIYAEDADSARTGTWLLKIWEDSATTLTDRTHYDCAPSGCSALAKEARANNAYFGKHCNRSSSTVGCLSLEWDGAIVVIEYRTGKGGSYEIAAIHEERNTSDIWVTGIGPGDYIP